MRKHYKIFPAIFLTAIITLGTVEGFSQNYLWANGAGGTGFEGPNSIATDPSGNVIISGYFGSPTIAFGTTTLTSAGTNDIFIAKYDGSGNLLWAKSAGGSGNDGSYGVTADASGNIIVTGYFTSSTLAFGTTTLTNALASNDDIFIVKYDGNGNVIWAKREGGTGNDWGTGVTSDAAGNIIVTGVYGVPTISFGATTFTNPGVGGSTDVFTVKYDSNGNILWAKNAGGPGSDISNSIAADASGNIIVTGNFKSTSITVGTNTLTNVSAAGYADIFTVKYDVNGNVLWAKSIGGLSDDLGYGVTADLGGNIMITGYFSSFTMTVGTSSVTNTGSNDILIVKYDGNGNVIWAKNVGGTGNDYGRGVATDVVGNIIVTGGFDCSTVVVGTTTLTNTNPGFNDLVIVKYDGSGNVVWAKNAGGTSHDGGSGVAVDPVGDIIVAGGYSSPTVTLGTTTLTNAGNQDIFIVKLGNITGIEENIKNGRFDIYPNPSNGIFSIRSTNLSTPLSVTAVEIYNVLGEKVYEANNEQGTVTALMSLDLSSQPKGIYFLNIKTEQGIVNKKIIISN